MENFYEIDDKILSSAIKKTTNGQHLTINELKSIMAFEHGLRHGESYRYYFDEMSVSITDKSFSVFDSYEYGEIISKEEFKTFLELFERVKNIIKCIALLS